MSSLVISSASPRAPGTDTSPGATAGGLEDQWEAVEADHARRPGDPRRRTGGERIVGHPAVPSLERDPHLHPGQVRAETAMRPAAERETEFLALEVDRVRIRVLGRVPGRGAHHDHAL